MTRARPVLWRRLAGHHLALGLAALAIAGVAVAISYRAQNGLPWLSLYRVQADVPDASKLLKNADVRIGGARVGQVLRIEAQPAGPGHPPFARLDLALDARVGPLPADSRVEVRLASVLGGKFLDLVPGTSEQDIPEGGVIPLANARTAVDTDEALLVFTPQTREDLRAGIRELGNALAGRGGALNRTLASTAAGLPAARRVLAVLAAPDTDLAGLLRGAAGASAAIEAAARGPLGAFLRDATATLRALDDEGLDRALVAAPPAIAAATRAARDVEPVLADAEAVVRGLGPAGALLPGTLERVDATVVNATPVVRRVGALAPAIDEALRALDAFSRNPSALEAVRGLGGNDLATFGGSAFVGLGAILRTAARAQLNCNAAALWIRNLASVASEGDSGGNWLRMVPVFNSQQSVHQAEPTPDLHVNPYPRENAAECEAGNEPYAPGRQIGNPPGDQARQTELTTQQERP